MNNERSQAYGRVVHTLRDMGPAKLLPGEQDRLREAADALFFCEDIGADSTALEAVSDMTALAQNLAESGRWTEERARELLGDVLACGPVETVA